MGDRTFLLLNGSPSGGDSNTGVLLSLAANILSRWGAVTSINLSDRPTEAKLEEMLRSASAFVVGSGTYWDSWGSPLQSFLENMTYTEGSDLWLGKPAAVIVTMHSVGGKGVLSRLQGVLSTLGAVIPPMSGMVYSAVAQVALEHDGGEVSEDLWQPSDIEVVCHNLVQCCTGENKWRSWPVDRERFSDKWISISD